MDISHNVKKNKQTKKKKKKLRDVVSLRTEFFQFDTRCQITRVPYQKEAQICNHLFLVYFFFADTMLLLVPKHFLVIIQKQVVMKSGFVFLGVKYC